MKIVLEVKYPLGSVVYFKGKQEKVPGIITYVLTRRNNNNVYTYGVTWSDDFRESGHSEYELTNEFVPDYVKEENEEDSL